MSDKTPRELISEAEISRRVTELAEQISRDYGEKGEIVLVGVLKGSFIFLADLARQRLAELDAKHPGLASRVELAEGDETRQQQLLDQGVISSEAYDVALAELNVLRAELQLIEAQLVKTRIRAPFAGHVGMRRVDLGAAEDPIEAAFDRGWSDGLPVTPPTEARVLAMLEGTSRPADAVVGVTPPNLDAAYTDFLYPYKVWDVPNPGRDIRLVARFQF
mgnify:CR=1 FL=1